MNLQFGMFLLAVDQATSHDLVLNVLWSFIGQGAL